MICSQTAAAHAVPPVSDPSRVVLVVDDDRVVLEAMARRAEADGFVACRAFSAAQAREQLVAVRFPVCLVDLHLANGERGTDLIAWARTRGMDTEFVVMTASDRREDVIASLRAGAFDYVEKPADPGLLSAALGRAASSVALRRESDDQARQLKSFADGLEHTVRERTQRLLDAWHVTNDILTSLPLGILRVDPSWSVDHVNPAAEAILGVSRDQLLGPVYRAECLSVFFEALKQASDEGRWGFARPLSLERGGERVWVDYRIVLLRPAAGTFRGAMVLIEEVSERVRLQRMLEETERLASFGKCAEGLARQLRDGLMSVLGWAEVVKHRLGGDPRGSEDLSNLMSAIEGCYGLIERSLDAAGDRTEVEA